MRKPAIGIFYENKINIESTHQAIKMRLCYAYGADVVFFTANDIDKESGTIKARSWTPEGFKSETTLLPHMVECNCAVNWQPYFRENSKLTNDYVLSKKKVSDAMIKSKFTPYIIPTIYTSLPEKILALFNIWPKLIIKPLAGARGENIFSAEKISDNEFLFTDSDKVVRTADAQGFEQLIAEIFGGLSAIVQPKMNFKNKDGQTMDFRINVTKSAQGKWETIYMIARTGRDCIVSNLSHGGYGSLIKPTLAIDYGEHADKIYETLETLAKEIPPYMEEISNCSMLSLGIDVGIDFETLNPYIIEVNYGPQVTFLGKDKYADAIAQYYAYLTKQIKDNLIQ